MSPRKRSAGQRADDLKQLLWEQGGPVTKAQARAFRALCAAAAAEQRPRSTKDKR